MECVGNLIPESSRFLKWPTETHRLFSIAEAERVKRQEGKPRGQNYPGAGTNPAPSLSRAFSYLSHTIPDFTDNCLINIMRCGDDFYATTETNYIRKINPQTLETLDKVSQAYSQRPCLTRERNPHSPTPGGGQAAYEELTGRSPPLIWCLFCSV